MPNVPAPWAPCPRCGSARVRYTPGRSAAWRTLLGLVCAFWAVVCLLGGLAMPCLWAGTLVFGAAAVGACCTASQDRGRCADCRHEWTVVPAAPSPPV